MSEQLARDAPTLDDLIRQAIAERRIVSYQYNGLRRRGEPHLYGTSGGQPKLLVYQTDGSFMGGPYPNWRRCDLKAMTRFALSTVTFSQPRLNPSDSHREWDEIWAIVK